MKGIVKLIEDNTPEMCSLVIELENGNTFQTTFDKKVMMARYHAFKRRYGTYPEQAQGLVVDVSPPCKVHGGHIDILSN